MPLLWAVSSAITKGIQARPSAAGQNSYMNIELPLSYEEGWTMKSDDPVVLAGSSSSEDASFSGRLDAEDDVLPVYLKLMDMLSQLEDPGRRHRAREFLFQKLSQHDATKCREMRCRLLKSFQHRVRMTGDNTKLSDFLDVVLDGTLDQIDLSEWSENEEQFNGEVFQRIIHRSPNVQTLNLYCADHMATSWVLSLNHYLCRMQHLVSLNLFKVPEACKLVINILGKNCIHLKFLRIGFSNCSLSDREMLSLFFASDIETLAAVAPCTTSPTESISSNTSELKREYHRCLVSQTLMFPYCETLEELRINRYQPPDPHIVGFILRHLPRLREFDLADYDFEDYSSGIRALWDISSPMECCEPSSSNPLAKNPIALANFTEKLALTSLFVEGDTDPLTFKSFCDLCPNLEKIQLVEVNIPSTSEDSGKAIEEIANDFKQLNKLHSLFCDESDGPLCAALAQAKAPLLTNLEMMLDDVFIPKLDFLIDCVNLRVLKLSTEFHPPLRNYFSSPSSASLTPQTFLPHLKEVQLEFCMNSQLEELFLLKPTLTHIDVLCLHHIGQTDDQLFELFTTQWPEIVNFKYKMPRKFSAELVLKILPLMPHLRYLSLYKDIKYRCASDFLQLKRSCRRNNVQLDLHLFLDTYLCIDAGTANDERVSTSDESETD